MARITVPFNGLTSHPNHKDGECSNLVNLRPKNGYLKPVPPRKKILYELSNTYDIVFIHRGSNYENWIGIQNYAGGSVIHTNLNAENHHYFKNLDESINSVQQIGNTLSFITESNIYYALWADNNYKYLGQVPELPDVRYGTDDMVTKKLTYLSEYGIAPPTNPDNRDELVGSTIGLVKKIIDTNKGFFHDAFLISHAFRLYDGSVIKHSAPILVMPKDNFSTWGVAYLPRFGLDTNFRFGDDSEVSVKLFKMNAHYNFSVLSDWKDIIKSVDFFVTKYIGLASPDQIKKEFYSAWLNTTHMHTLYPPYVRPGEITFDTSPVDKVIEASMFYLYYSTDDFSGAKTTIFPDSNTTVKDDFYNIINQERMPADSFSHHRIGADNATTYNNRLRLTGLRTKFYKGFSAEHFNWGSTKYNGEASEWEQGLKSATVYVYLKTNEGVQVQRTDSIQNVFLGAYISYPDPRAYKLVIRTGMTSDNVIEGLIVSLTPHPSLDIAYAINSGLLPFKPNYSLEGATGLPSGSSTDAIYEPNKLKVSEINNPFVFPNLNTYQIGSGKILNESSIIMNVSDRNYGMYPVFVFTTDGVFTMAGQTPESVHDSIQAPTYLEPPISNVIAPTPYGVVFITQRGLMQISQYQTSFLSPQLREDDDTVVLSQKDEIVGDTISYPVIPFTTFLKSAKAMLYNPYHDELIIASRGNPYCYVYDFASKSFYISTETIDVIVQNSFPDIYTLNDNYHIKDYSQYESKQSQISLITRPLSFGTSDIKTLHRIWLRALMHNVINMSVVAFHSLDGVNYQPAKGATFGGEGDENNYKDFDLGLFARETYRKYIFLLTGTVDEDTQIRYAEFEISKRYDNDKMR